MLIRFPLAVLVVSTLVAAQTPTYISPKGAATTLGPSNNNIPFSWTPCAYQQVHSRDSFNNLTPGAINQMSFRMASGFVNQTGFTTHAWATGSNSFLCVKSLIQRTGIGNSNGTTGACNGALLFGWNAYQTSHPSALGNPFAVGQKVYAQCWYRDPPAPKTTNLTDAVELTCVP